MSEEMLHPNKSMGARITAISFIVLIIAGNFWFVNVVIAKPVPIWLAVLGLLGIVGVFLGGLGLGFSWFKYIKNIRENSE